MRDDLRKFVSLATFESTDLTTFRSSLAESLRTTIAIKGSNLSELIPWKELVKAHDKRDHTTQLSLLQVVCEQLCNPTVIPMAYSANVVLAFLEGLLSKAEKPEWRSSEKYLLDCAMKIINRIPMLSLLPPLEGWQDAALHDKPAREIRSKRVDAARFHKYVSVLAHLANNRLDDCWFSAGCTTLLFHMVRKLDAVDVELLRPQWQTQSAVTPQDVCLTCQLQIRPMTESRRRRRNQISLSQLLDDSAEPEERVVVVNTQAVDSCRCTFDARRPLSHTLTRLPFDFVTLRSRAYETILSIVARQHSLRASWQHRDLLCVGPAAIVVERLLDMIGSEDDHDDHDQPSSLRLCLLLMAHSIGHDYIVNRLWERYDQSSKHVWLRTWSELLVESAYYDAAQPCWAAMKALFTRVLSYCHYHDHDGEVHTLENPTTVHQLLRTLSYVLSHRRPTLLEDATQTMKVQYQDALTRISFSFGESSNWISNKMSPQEEESIVETLQSVGILGLLQDGNHGRLYGCSQWPFTDSVREAYNRMGPRVVTKSSLLSKPSNVNERQRLANAEVRKQELMKKRRDGHDDALDGIHKKPVLLECVNDDTLNTVMSYLNHVELVRMGSVNIFFHSMAQQDCHWKRVYESHYDIRGDPFNTERIIAKIKSWRNIFLDKYLSEKALKFKYSSSGFKYRTCSYIGCHTIIKSSEQQAKHLVVHEKKDSRDFERREAARQRLKEREALKKKKKKAEASTLKKPADQGRKINKRDRSTEKVEVSTRKRKRDSHERQDEEKVKKARTRKEKQDDEATLENCVSKMETPNHTTCSMLGYLPKIALADKKGPFFKRLITHKAGKKIFRVMPLSSGDQERRGTETIERVMSSISPLKSGGLKIAKGTVEDGVAQVSPKCNPPATEVTSVDADRGSDSLSRTPCKTDFLTQLRAILDSAEQRGLCDIVSWHPDGKSFFIHKQHEFENRVMPVYFSTIKGIRSFRGKLQAHGFDYVRKRGPDRGAYYLAGFIRTDMDCRLTEDEDEPTGPPVDADSWDDGVSIERKKMGSGWLNACEDSEITKNTTQQVPHRAAPLSDEKSDCAKYSSHDKGEVASFPIMLHELLTKAERDGRTDVVSWQPHGRCFRIHKPKEFRRLNTIDNFKEQLVSYGFSVIRQKGPDRLAYYHDLFLRGKTSLARQIPRLEGHDASRKRNADEEPDFYQMPPILPENDHAVPEQDPTPCFSPKECSTLFDRTIKSHDALVPPHQPTCFIPKEDGSYTDYGNVSTIIEEQIIQENEKRMRDFPIHLHRMLERVEQDGYSHIVSWQPHGRSFRVHKPKEFEDFVMPLYLKTLNKFPSFRNTLPRYNFTMMRREGPDKGAYYHELFLRGKVSLAHRIPWRRTSGNGRKGRRPVPSQEPDFYAMPVIVPDVMLGNADEPGMEELDFGGRHFHDVPEDSWSLPGIQHNEEDLCDLPSDVIEL